MLHEEELKDFIFVINKFKKKFGCKIFLCGLSAGSCYGARILGKYPCEVQVEGYVSISNPFNFAQVCYHLEKSLFGRVISGAMYRNAKKILQHHSTNPLFKQILQNNDIQLEEFFKDMEEIKTMLQCDSKII